MGDRVLIVSDTHGDMEAPGWRDELAGFIDDFRPQVRVHLGDAWDLRCLRGKVNADEANEGLHDDMNAGMDFVRWYKPDVFLMGNHDHRLPKKASEDHRPMVREYCRLLLNAMVESLGDAKIIRYGASHGVLMGGVWLQHGYCAGVHAAYKSASHYGTTIMGHIHTATGPVPYPTRANAKGYSCSSGCRLDMEYGVGMISGLRQTNGWMTGVIRDGELTDLRHHIVDLPYLGSEDHEFRVY